MGIRIDVFMEKKKEYIAKQLGKYEKYKWMSSLVAAI